MNDSLNKAAVGAAVYEACLSAATALGDDLKSLSWFGKNARRSAVRRAA